MFGFDGVDFCYPFVCSFSNSADDHKVLIAYCYTSPINYPGVLVSGVDNQMNWTDAAIVAQGQNYVEVGETQGVTRWGDYACIVRKYDEQNPKAWLSGGFGNTQEIQSQLYYCLDTWIAEVTGIEPGINEISDISSQIKVYPNPVNDLFSIDFNLNKRKKIEIYIIDINGKLVRLLYKDTANKGKSTITFNKEALNPGTYFIIIKTNQKNISNEKIIISH